MKNIDLGKSFETFKTTIMNEQRENAFTLSTAPDYEKGYYKCLKDLSDFITARYDGRLKPTTTEILHEFLNPKLEEQLKKIKDGSTKAAETD